MTRSSMTIERHGQTIEIDVYGKVNAAEHDVGIMGAWCEEVHAKDMGGSPVDLTEDEERKAEELLAQRYMEDDGDL